MAKKKKKSKGSLARNRSKRKFQSKKLEKRIKTSRERSKGGGKNIIKDDIEIQMWRPKDGSHIVDVIPYFAGKHDPNLKEGEDSYSYEYWAHTNVGPGNTMILCPIEMFDEPCPICEHRQKLRDKGVDDEKWKKLFPKRRNLYNIISYDKGEQKKGIQVWDISWHYFEKFVLAIAKKTDRRTGKEKSVIFPDPVKGKSINFEIEPAKGKDDYPKYLGHSFDNRGYEIEDEVLDSVLTLDEIVHKPEYDEIEKIYWSSREKEESKKKKGKKDKDEGNEELDELIEELEDLDDKDELKEFIEENDLEVKIKKWKDIEGAKEKIIDAIKESFDSDDDDDDKDDDDDDEEYTVEDIEEMNKKKLKKLIEEEDLDVDPDDAEDLDELREMVIEELDIEED